MFRKIFDYLDLPHAGGLELFFALLPILSAYGFYGIPLGGILWVGLFVLLFFKPNIRQTSMFKPLVVLTVFILIHDFIYLFIANGNLNAYIMQIVYFGSIFMAVKVFNIDKLKGSLNLVAIVSMAGLLYQWGIIASGGDVRPIQLPFLDMEESRLESFSIRPSSFFMEPAAYVAFMYLPLAFSLVDRKFIWTIVIILSEFLTTSTTGLLTSFIILIAYVFSQKVSFKFRFFTVVMGVIMLFVLVNAEVFRSSVNKLEDTDIETNMRLAQGPYVVSTMNSMELVAGALYHNAYDYCMAGRASDVVFYKEEVFMSTTWIIILKYGLIGLFLYILVYYKIARANRETIPLIICLIAAMFSSGYGLGMNFVYTLIGLLMMNLKNKQKTILRDKI